LTVYAARIEAGGSKWECAIGTVRTTSGQPTLPTTTPAETIDRTVAFFEREGPVDAVGIGSRPTRRKRRLADPGYITTIPKPGWAQTDFGREIKRRLGVPVAFDTDVNAAALRGTAGERARTRHLLLHHSRHRHRRRRDGRR
jgi:fructokinase